MPLISPRRSLPNFVPGVLWEPEYWGHFDGSHEVENSCSHSCHFAGCCDAVDDQIGAFAAEDWYQTGLARHSHALALDIVSILITYVERKTNFVVMEVLEDTLEQTEELGSCQVPYHKWPVGVLVANLDSSSWEPLGLDLGSH